MGEQHQDEQQAAGRGRHHEESPRPRSVPHDSPGTCATSVTVAGDDGPCTSRRSPDRRPRQVSAIRRGCAERPTADLPPTWSESTHGRHGNRRSTQSAPTLPASRTPEAAAVPRDDGLRLDDDQRRSPLVPHTRQPDPQPAVRPSEPQPPRPRSLQHLQLMTQGQHLQLECGAGTSPSQGSRQRRGGRPSSSRSVSARSAATSTVATRTDFSAGTIV